MNDPVSRVGCDGVDVRIVGREEVVYADTEG